MAHVLLMIWLGLHATHNGTGLLLIIHHCMLKKLWMISGLSGQIIKKTSSKVSKTCEVSGVTEVQQSFEVYIVFWSFEVSSCKFHIPFFDWKNSVNESDCFYIVQVEDIFGKTSQVFETCEVSGVCEVWVIFWSFISSFEVSSHKFHVPLLIDKKFS